MKRNTSQTNSKAKPTPYAVDDKFDTSVVAEPAVKLQYLKAVNNSNPLRTVILNNTVRKPESKMTSYEKIKLIKDGISKQALENLKEKANLDYNQLAQIFSVARATLINKKGEEKFDVWISEKIIGVADIYSYGYEVFEDEERFNDWIFKTNKALGGLSPFDLLDNQYGREEVRNLIGRIDYGVYS